MVVIRRVDEHWAEGRLADRIGIFPISFVHCNQAAKRVLSGKLQSSVTAVSQAQPVEASSGVQSPRAIISPTATVGILITTASVTSVTSTARVTSPASLAASSSTVVASTTANKRHSLQVTSPLLAPAHPNRRSMEVPGYIGLGMMTSLSPTNCADQALTSPEAVATAEGRSSGSKMQTQLSEEASSPRSKSSLPAM